MVKVVLDTNVIVSGFNFPSGNPAKILDLIAYGFIKNFISAHILNEVDYVLSQKFIWEKNEVKSAKSWLEIFSKKVLPKKIIGVVPHRADNKILACAVKGKVNFIISGDKHLTSLKNYKKIKILTPREFLDFLMKKS